MNQSKNSVSWDPRDYGIEDRYPKRNRKSKIDDLSSLEEPDYINKAEKLSVLPYDVDEICNSAEYEHDNVVNKLPIEELTLGYIKKTGLSTPLFFDVPPEALGMKMPSPDKFTVDDVLECIGGQRKIEVVEVYEQNGRLMKLEEFIKYYKTPQEERKELLNVLSLEFTSTKLAEKVSAPAFVTEIDWIDTVWPRELFKRQENLLKHSSWAREHDFSTYPKVQRYCLMSVKGCFTDYHIDFGGTSVWYHILKGEKVFWLIEPTEENLKLYEEWILGGSNNTCFFGKIVSKCTRVHLKAGNTLVIPSGWIHCVYTPCDSLVFGGNFLHSFSIPMQIRVSRSEDRIKIGSKYRFPHFKQIFWCYIAQTIQSATGRIYQRTPTVQAHITPSANETDEQSSANNDEASSSTNHQELGPSDEEEDHQIERGDIFYDDFGNAQDGTFTFNPIQFNFGNQQAKEFRPVGEYNTEFLESLSPFEVNGLHSLFPMANRLLKARQPEVVEGITRPVHLVMELEGLLRKLSSMDLLNLQKSFKLNKRSSLSGNSSVQFTTTSEPTERVELSVKLAPKKTAKRRSTDSAPMNSKKSNKVNGERISAHPTVLVGGLPLPTSAGNIQMDALVPLGHKPIPSAWRRSSTMAKPALSDMPVLKKYNQIQNLDETNTSNLPETDVKKCEHFASPAPSNSTFRKIKVRFVPRLTAKMIEVHDDSPELAQKSPLQRFTAVQKANSSSNLDNRINSGTGTWSKPEQKYSRHRDAFDDGRKKWDSRRDNYRNNNSYGNGGGFNSHSWDNVNGRDPFKSNNAWGQSPPRAQEESTSKGSVDQNWPYPNAFTSSVPMKAERPKSPEQMEVEDMDIEVEQEEAQQQSHHHQALPMQGHQSGEAQPMSVSVSVEELHHISQSMNNPMADYAIDQIPLPPSPDRRRPSSSKVNGNVDEEEEELSANNNKLDDPFTQVDELAQLTQMFEQH